jgi:hypothetical protein
MTMRTRILTGLAAAACAFGVSTVAAPTASAAICSDGQMTVNSGGGSCYVYAWYQNLAPHHHDQVSTAANRTGHAMCFGEWRNGQAFQLDAFFNGDGPRQVAGGNRADFLANCGYF